MKRRILRIALWIGVPLVLLTALAGGSFYAMLAKFYPDPPPHDFPMPKTALDAQRQDLAYFRKLIALDRSFSPSARAEAERRIGQLEHVGHALEHPKFRVALMEIVALADNGHTRMGSDPGAYPRLLPVRVFVFPDGVYIMRAKDKYADLLGAKVLAIDGHSIETVLKRLEQLRGGTAAWRRTNAMVYIVAQDVLYGSGISAIAQHSTWTVQKPDGAIVSRVLATYVPPESEPSPHPDRWLSTDLLKGMTKGWRALQPNRAIGISRQDFNRPFREVRLSNSCAALVQLKSNEDEDGAPIGDFLKKTETDLRAHPPCAIVLDMRYNGGGDYTNTATFARHLPGMMKPGGRIYLLTSPATFSAGITTTAFVKEAGGDRVTILGEPVGDRLAFYAEGGRGCLPNYRLCMNYQTGKHDYGRPCWDPDVCFWLNWLYPVRVKSLQPDENIAMSFADWKAGRDPVFDRTMALAKVQMRAASSSLN